MYNHRTSPECILGLLLGYPNCCIKAYPLDSVYGLSVSKDGYFPCPSCSKKSEGLLIKEIEGRRLIDPCYPHFKKNITHYDHLVTPNLPFLLKESELISIATTYEDLVKD